MSDTPRTDDNTIRIEFSDGPFQCLTYVPVEFAQQIERELAAVNAESEQYRSIAEAMGAKKAVSELEKVKADRDRLRGIIYRATVAKLSAETGLLAFVPAEDIAASLEIVREMRRDLK